VSLSHRCGHGNLHGSAALCLTETIQRGYTLHEDAAEMPLISLNVMCCVYIGSSAHVVGINSLPDQEIDLGSK